MSAPIFNRFTTKVTLHTIKAANIQRMQQQYQHTKSSVPTATICALVNIRDSTVHDNKYNDMGNNAVLSTFVKRTSTNPIQQQYRSYSTSRHTITTKSTSQSTAVGEYHRYYSNTPIARAYVELDRHFCSLSHSLDYAYTLLADDQSATLLNDVYNALVKHFQSNNQINNIQLLNIVHQAKEQFA